MREQEASIGLPLLKPKLFFPVGRAAMVYRPRLVERLQAGLQAPLTLVSAPAGYGKTTLLAEWRAAAGRETPAAWLSLDAGDNSLFRFLQYLAAALEGLQGGMLEGTLALLQPPHAPAPETVLTVLLNELAAFPEDFVLVLDDYHLISEEAVHHAVAFLLEHQLPGMHLVVLTRADPPLPLARLRARGQLTEIRAVHLRFTEAETSAFLTNVMRLQLSTEDILRLAARTEGWAAGLQLAALSLQGRNPADMENFLAEFTGGHAFILDYLVDEVISRLPADQADFLLKTAILERLNGDLCNAVTGGRDGKQVLAALHRSNVFITPIDDAGRWFRCHPLFSSMLENHLRQVDRPLIPELHRRAAAWLEQNNMVEEAVEHAATSGDPVILAALLIRHARYLFSSADRRSLHRWLDALPEEMVSADPRLGVMVSNLLWSQGRRDVIDVYLQRAAEAYEQLKGATLPGVDPDEWDQLPAEICYLQSLIASERGDLPTAIERAQEALALAPPGEHTIRAFAALGLFNAYREMGLYREALQASRSAIPDAQASGSPGLMLDAYCGVGLMLQVQGALQSAAQVYEEGIRFAEGTDRLRRFQFALAYVELANVHYAWNDLTRAEVLLEEGLILSEQGGRRLVAQYGRIFLGRLRAAQGRQAEALAILEQNAREVRQAGISAIRTQVEAALARCRAAMGLHGAADWLDNLDSAVGERPGYRRMMLALQAAHVQLALGRYTEAEQLAARIQDAAGRSGAAGWQIEAMALLATALYRQGKIAAGLQTLRRALDLAETGRPLRTFLDFGGVMPEMLQALQRLGDATGFAHEVLAAAAGQPAVAQQQAAELLSERELEVLRLVAAGYTNQQIAGQLVIALGTVKRHTANIFDKLDVYNRTEAVARARELGII